MGSFSNHAGAMPRAQFEMRLSKAFLSTMKVYRSAMRFKEPGTSGTSGVSPKTDLAMALPFPVHVRSSGTLDAAAFPQWRRATQHLLYRWSAIRSLAVGGNRGRRSMATLIITEKTSQARDVAAALGDRFGKILPAEGHLLRLAEPDEVNGAWKSWSCVLLKPDSLYPTRPAREGNKPAKLKAIAEALRACEKVIIATDCDREASSSVRRSSSIYGFAARSSARCSPRRTQDHPAGLFRAEAEPRDALALRSGGGAPAGRPDLQPVADPHGDQDAARARHARRDRHRPGEDADARHRLPPAQVASQLVTKAAILFSCFFSCSRLTGGLARSPARRPDSPCLEAHRSAALYNTARLSLFSSGW
jgi:hypothetical protein